MIAKIRNYIQRAFEDVPKTKKSTELQEELISNLVEKFNDQLKLGKTEEEAYQTVIAGIGDLSELTEGLRERHVLSVITPAERKKSALLVAIAVGLFIISPMMVVIFSEFGLSTLGIAMMFTCIATGVGLLIYNGASKPKYIREEETLVEEFKEWKSKNSKNRALYGALGAAYWLIVVAIYLFVSFNFSAFHYSWIIFIIAAAVYNIIKALYLMGQKDE
ncbi:MAG: hypothetical protein CVU85_07895 [Firmicutes bacterium HGW-Firmicutes-10]|jgi:replicative DNA helicase|nr:MAG: hypothetical protein CVU85_07895 [Firmicutes bacterium HGW-Firmicutes-10]